MEYVFIFNNWDTIYISSRKYSEKLGIMVKVRLFIFVIYQRVIPTVLMSYTYLNEEK